MGENSCGNRPHPKIQPKWLVAAVLAKRDVDYNILSVHRSETIDRGGLDTEIKIQMTNNDKDSLLDELTFPDGRLLSVLVRREDTAKRLLHAEARGRRDDRK